MIASRIKVAGFMLIVAGRSGWDPQSSPLVTALSLKLLF